jgi:hypothetical protein
MTMPWTLHTGYINDSDANDTSLIFVQENIRSYLAVSIFTGKSRSVFKKDKDKLFKRLSDPVELTVPKMKNILGETESKKRFMDKFFDQNNFTREVKTFLEVYSRDE